MQIDVVPDEIVAFWREAGPSRWFVKDEAFDARCVQRFHDLWEAGTAGMLAAWEPEAESARRNPRECSDGNGTGDSAHWSRKPEPNTEPEYRFGTHGGPVQSKWRRDTQDGLRTCTPTV